MVSCSLAVGGRKGKDAVRLHVAGSESRGQTAGGKEGSDARQR